MARIFTYYQVAGYIKSELSGVYDHNEISGLTRFMIEKLAGRSAITLMLYSGETIEAKTYKKIVEIVSRLKKYEPIQYIFGKADFYDLEFAVTPGVLIPRQETEELVDWIIRDCKKRNDKVIRIADLCTGSGCIAIALAVNILNSIVTATDYSDKILDSARKNAVKNNTRIKFLKGDILSLEPNFNDEAYDVIVSNPPYVTLDEKKLVDRNVLDYEPAEALFVPDTDPLLFYKKILAYAKTELKTEGIIYFEINEAFGKQMIKLLESYSYKNIELRKDINGKDRMIKGEKR